MVRLGEERELEGRCVVVEANNLLDLSSGGLPVRVQPKKGYLDLLSLREDVRLDGLDDEVRVHVKPVGSHTESDGLSDSKVGIALESEFLNVGTPGDQSQYHSTSTNPDPLEERSVQQGISVSTDVCLYWPQTSNLLDRDPRRVGVCDIDCKSIPRLGRGRDL